ncbi:hypothetical protein HPB51_005147 [Rhipicephalus microplus]|uniref:Transposable element P transposase-like RNase H domain-containing protein n=1 Tax=Rhipicephalus microplus TaxID=6941 RepID=A0A9J6EMF9_RHIMP|nr:hypothetical protein HPB51_005147 [Rhipicephalus microplus]
MFQPFQGNWTQILGVFSSKGNVKANILSKILLEATMLAEKSGFFVDYWTCDGAPWNRSLWKLFGIKASIEEIKCKVPLPVDARRSLHFISDFPHLVKCVRNAFVSEGLQIPTGRAHADVIKEAWKEDQNSLTLKVMPRITKSDVQPNSFEKMRHVINGEDVEFDRERPSLTPDVVPTIFPDGPAYLTKSVPRKIKERNIADSTAPPAKRKAPNEPTTSQACDDAAAGEETAQAPHPFHSIMPPSAFCSEICLPSNPEALCFAWHYNTVPGDVCVLKHVVFSSSKEVGAADGYLCSTYCRGINVEEHYVSTETDALASLKRADDLLLCCGCEIEPAAGTKQRAIAG